MLQVAGLLPPSSRQDSEMMRRRPQLEQGSLGLLEEPVSASDPACTHSPYSTREACLLSSGDPGVVVDRWHLATAKAVHPLASLAALQVTPGVLGTCRAIAG